MISLKHIAENILTEEVSEYDYIVGEDLKNEQEINTFVKVNGFDPIILDIWKYVKNNFGIYPNKIIKLRGSVGLIGLNYQRRGSKHIEIYVHDQKLKRLPDIYLFDFDTLIRGGKFTYKLLSEFMSLSK